MLNISQPELNFKELLKMLNFEFKHLGLIPEL